MSAPETTPIARDFASALEMAGRGCACQIYVPDSDAEREALGKLRSRLGEKRRLVEVLVAAPRPGTCSSCHAAILWARTPAGASMPLDAKPEKRVILGQRTGLAHVVDTYTPHWASCPNAAQHRRDR